MRSIGDQNYLAIGEVAKQIERGHQTIRSWYKWLDEQPDEVKEKNPLPSFRRDLDAKGTRYFLEDDLPMLVEFRDNIKYGNMAEFNNKRWGARGDEIRERKSTSPSKKKEQ